MNENQPPPPPPFARAPMGRNSSWQRVSAPGAGSMAPPPPPPPPSPPHSGGPSEPRSGNGVFTPDMLSEVRKFMDAGGYEGMKRRILEEVGEQLKGDSDRDSDRDSLSSGSSPPPPSFPRHPPPNTSPRSAPGPPLPHTPPDSPHSRPQSCHPARPGGGPPPPPPTGPPAQRKGEAARGAELSPVDRCWGELFDANGRATKRLGQVLRGLANYLISQDAPSESVVISPSKLSAFYTKFAVKDEPHPYAEIFTCEDNKESYLDIIHLYEDLECEYHLAKSCPTSRARPLVPSLTPAGFVKWCITSILAYPEVEAARLGAVVARLPVEVEAGGKSERLPKQLSRRLLPAMADKVARRDLNGAVEEVLYERGVREKKGKRTEYGNGEMKTRPAGKRSESEPLPRRDQSSEDGGKKRGTKYVSFGRASSRAPEYISTPASSRRPGERAGRPYNLSGKGQGEEREPGSPGQFELSSGRDRERDKGRDGERDREREYGRDSALRRGSGEGRDRDRDAGRKRRRRKDVVVEQEREPSWMKILREVSSIYD